MVRFSASNCWLTPRRCGTLASLLLVLALLLPLAGAQPATPAAAQESSPLPWRDKSSPFGVVASLGNRVHEAEIPEMVGLMREAGVQWQREEIFWDRVQKAPGGPFDWDGDGSGLYNYDLAISTQAAAGINMLGLLDYNPYWFKGKNPHPDEWIEDWGNYVYATVARYGRDQGAIKHWELWNEPNLAGSGYESGLYEVRDFVRILEVGAAAARAADPEATIVMAGMASIWGVPPNEHNSDYFTYLERVGELGGWEHVDVIAIHPYRPDAPEGTLEGRAQGAQDFRIEMQHLDELLRRFGPKPVWITEMGWSSSTGWPGVDPDTQAFFLIRFYIVALTHPSIEKIFWYDLRNDTWPDAPYDQPVIDPNHMEMNFGLLRRTYPLDSNDARLRKPAFLAYRTMTQMLSGTWLREILFEGNHPNWPGIFWYAFEGNGRRVDVLWRTEDVAPELELFCDCREALVRNWNGEIDQLLYSVEGAVTLRLNNHGAPIFVEYDPPVVPGGQYFEATGHSLRGAFLRYWQNNGGVQRFGMPLTEEVVIPLPGHGRPHVVQYFERARFEHFPQYSGSPAEVGLTRLGDAVLQQQGVNWQTLPRDEPPPPPPAEDDDREAEQAEPENQCVHFYETGRNLCPPFRAAWEAYGGRDSLGLPLTAPIENINEATGNSYTVQYFERARLEYFPEHQGTPNEIQFGMLGREYLVRQGMMR
jgi:hypothetical protein